MFKKVEVIAVPLCRDHVTRENKDSFEAAGAGQGREASFGGTQRPYTKPEKPGLPFPNIAPCVCLISFLLAPDPFHLPVFCGWRRNLRAYPQSG